MTIEKKLIDIWRSLLAIEHISIYDNFFDIGGDQLLFMALTNRIQTIFGLDSAIFIDNKFKSISEQANFIKRLQRHSHQSMLVNLRPGCNNHPMIFIHPVGGTLFGYMPLINKLITENNIWGIQENFLFGDFNTYDSLEEQASFYIFKLKKILNCKSIILAGHSMGGSIAFEMCRQLISDKYNVKHLIIFDSWAKMPFDVTFRNRFKEFILRQFDKIKPDHFLDMQENLDTWLITMWKRMELLLRYKPVKIPVNATLFLPGEIITEYQTDTPYDNGWSEFVNQLQCYKVLGNHETMLTEQNVEPVSNHFNTYLSSYFL